MEENNIKQETECPVAQHPDYQAEITAILRSNLIPKLKQERILSYHENDIAETLKQLTEKERGQLYRILTDETLARVLEYAGDPVGCLGELSMKRRVAVLLRFEASTAVGYLRQMSKADRSNLLDMMDPEEQREIVLLSSFDEDEIGSKMTTNYISVHSGLTVKQVMRTVIEEAAEHDNISTIYVIGDEGTFLGAIDLKKLIIAREGTDLDAIMMTSYPYVYATEPIEDCINRMVGYSEDSFPVLNGENKLQGVITSKDLMQLVGDEMSDDYAKLAGLSAEEDLREPLRASILKRLPWLILLFGLGMLVSSVVGVFEGVVAQLPLIIAFQSLVLDMAGNVGTQSLAVTVRVLMDEQVGGKDKLYLVGKEVRVGLVNGLILGVASFLLVGLYLMAFKGQAPSFAFAISGCTGIALLVAMLLSGLSGTVIPLLFKKIHVDPAVASGPLITTLNDLVAVVTYYGLAWFLLLGVSHL